MFKAYRKRNGKTYGPYYYKNIRIGKKVKTIYLGGNRKEALEKEKAVMKQFQKVGQQKVIGQKTEQIAVHHFFVAAVFVFICLTFFIYSVNPWFAGMLVGTGNYTTSQPENSENVLNVETVRQAAMLGRPVKWSKKIQMETPEVVKVGLPKYARNITVNKVENMANGRKQIAENVIVTGKLMERKGIASFLINLLTSFIKSFTGMVIGKETLAEEIVEVTINDTATDYDIEYETPPPTAEETRIGKGKKSIAIQSEMPYTDIVAYTVIEETPPERIKASKGVELIDNNNDDLIDEVQWLADTGEQVNIEIQQEPDTAYSRSPNSVTYKSGDTYTTVISGKQINFPKNGKFVPTTQVLDMYASYDNKIHLDYLGSTLTLTPYYYSAGSKYYLENIQSLDVKPHTHIYDNKNFYKYAFGIFNFSEINAEKVGFEVNSSEQVIATGNVLRAGSIQMDFSDIAENHTVELGPDFIEVSGTFSQDLWLDPVVTLTAGNITNDGDVYYNGATYLRENTSATFRVVEETITPIQKRGYIEFNTADIPDTATINDIDLNISVQTSGAGSGFSVKPMELRPSSVGNQTIWTDAGNGTNYNSSAADVCGSPPAGPCWVYLDLGTQADTDLKNNLTSNYFAVGFLGAGDEDNIIDASEGTSDPKLIVNYTEATGDSTPPLIRILSPGNTSYQTTVSFNISSNETLSNCVFTLDGWTTNYTMALNSSNTGAGIINSSMAVTTHNAKFWCNDTTGNANGTEQVYFTVETTLPLVTITSPTNTTYNTTTIEFNFTLNEPGSCRYTLDSGIANYTMTANGSNTGFSATNTTIPDGTYTVIAYCNDTAGNINSTQTVGFTVDTTPPRIRITSPLNITYGSVVRFNVSSNENLSYCKFTLDSWVTNYTMVLNSSNTGAGYTNTSMLTGTYTAIFWCNDTVGNINSSQNITFSIDFNPPQITIISPANLIYVSTVQFNLSSNKVLDFCKFTLDNWATNYTMSQYNLTYFIYTDSSMAIGSYTARFWCNDTGGNINNTEQIGFSVAVLNINLNLLYPTSSQVNVIQNRFFNVTANVTCLNANCGEINISLDPSPPSYNTTGLFALWHLDEASGVLLDDGPNDFNLTTNTPGTNYSVPGVFGTGIGFVGTVSSYGKRTSQFHFPTDAGTLELWYKPLNSSAHREAFYETSTSEQYETRHSFRRKEDNSLSIYEWPSIDYYATQPLNWTENEWYHIVFMWNSTGRYVYRNGSLINSTTSYTTLYNYSSASQILGFNLCSWYGCYPEQYGVNGTLDEVVIWNRTLTQTEILEHYNTGMLIKGLVSTTTGAIPFHTNESNPRNITLNAGQNQIVVFWVNATGAVGDTYGFYVYANRTANMSQNNQTGKWNVTIQAGDSPPQIRITSPSNQSYNTQTISFNISSNENLSFCRFTIDSWATNYTMTLNSTNTGAGLINTSMAVTTHNAKFWCNDTAGNINNTKQVTFTIDITPPYFTDISNQTVIYREPFLYDINASDALSGVNCFGVNDTTNFTINCSGHLRNATYLNITVHWLNITVNDTAGNRNSTVIYVNVTIDTTPPLIELISPANGYSTTTASITFSYNVTDAATIANCSLIIGGSVDQTDITITKNAMQTFSKTLSVRSYIWSVNCTDLSGNIGNSTGRTLIIASAGGGEETTPAPGGGGGYITTPTKPEPVIEPSTKTETLEGVKPGEIYTFEFTKPLTGEMPAGDIFAVLKDQPPVTSVSIDVSEELKDVSVSVTKLEDKPLYASQPSAETYSFVNQYFEVKATTKVEEKEVSISEKIRESIITVFVEKAWLEENQATKASVKVLRLHENEWQELDTKAVKQDEYFVYYEAKVSGLSLFTIVTKKIQPGAQVCDSFDKKCFENELRECSPYGTQWLKLEDCKYGCENEKCKERPAGAMEQLGGIAIWIALAVFVIFVLGLYVFVKMR